MKHILITGADSYIGGSFEKWVSRWSDQYRAETLDMRIDAWRSHDFSAYDAVFHVAGIAHADTGHASPETKALYYRVNTDLAVETAQKAKADGAGQFIFMSSASVYGESAPIGCDKLISRDTAPQPANFYGDSKLQAERGLRALDSDSFRVCILRPPMIYGPGCKGNYPVLSRYAKKLPFFPDAENLRSMLYIDNLAEFVRLMVEHRERGVFFPQNTEYVRTSDLVKAIAAAHGRRIRLTRAFNPALRLLGKRMAVVNKAFGSMRYDMEMSAYPEDYRVCSFAESIRRTEGV